MSSSRASAFATPDIAVDRNSGVIYIVWQDGRISGLGASNVMIAASADGNFTWTAPIPITGSQVYQHFLPTVVVNDDGVIGILFYDFRNDDFFGGTMAEKLVGTDIAPPDLGGGDELTTDVWPVTVNPDGTNAIEERLTDESFDMRQMVIAGGFFPGDYVGLDTAANDFVAAFTIANDLGLAVDFPDNSVLSVDNNNRQDIVFKRVSR